MSESGGPEQARQTADSCFELVGSHQRCACTSCSGRTSFMYPKVSLLIVVSGIHPPQTAELRPREKPHLKNLMPQYAHVHVHVGTLDSATPWRSKCVERRVWHCIGCETAHSTDMGINWSTDYNNERDSSQVPSAESLSPSLPPSLPPS